MHRLVSVIRKKSIGTHNGAFHADEAFACALLKGLPAFASHAIVRTRDASILDECDIVVDVGGVYEHAKRRYDHHQPTFTDTFSVDFKTTLSSAGLVYKHYGLEFLRGIVASTEGPLLAEDDLRALHIHLYRSFVEPFDGVDNGISAYPVDIKPLYARPWTIQDSVFIMNPVRLGANAGGSAEEADESFKGAVELVGGTFRGVVEHAIRTWIPSRHILSQAIIPNSAGRILVLDEYCHWKEHVYDLEPSPGQYLYVVYGEPANSTWRVQAVPVDRSSFESRKPLPVPWRGLRDDALDRAIASEDVEGGAVFVHRTGFIGGHQTRSGAIAMAELAARYEQE